MVQQGGPHEGICPPTWAMILHYTQEIY